MTAAVPHEIVDEILSYLSEDVTTLMTCSTVSSAFREPSQRRLFHSLDLNLGHPASFKHLHLALSSNPDIVSYIRSVKIGLCEDFDGDAVCVVLRILEHRVQVLQFDNISSFSLLGTWDNMPEPIKLCLLNLIYGPSCISLTLGDIFLPAGYLRGASHLRQLNLLHADSTVSGDPTHPPTVHEPSDRRGYLEVLVLGTYVSTQRLLQALLHPLHPSSLSLSQLRRLYASHQVSAEFQTLLDLSAGYLEEVHVGVSLYFSGEHLDFSQLTRLRSLHIAVWSGVQAEPGVWLPRVLASMPQITDLQVTMSLSLGYRIQAAEWKECDALLTQERHLGMLRRVSFHLEKQSAEMIRWFLKERTPKLAEKGILVVSS
ncbi:hypothetical protein FPV67DRAFT_1514181, partial [Lyophyllum atratum]